MYVEVYLDTFLIFQFVMNLLVLGLINEMMRQKVGRKRRVWGALAGAFFSVLPLMIPMNLYMRIASAFVLSLGSMIFITFRIYNADSFYRVAEKVVISTLLLGGMTLVVLRVAMKRVGGATGLVSVLGAGLIAYVLLRVIVKRHYEEDKLCKVILFGEETVEIRALIDTGNTLAEPISGKSVSVLDKGVFESLYHQKPQIYRVIPYHSVGKKRGILQGFLMKKMIVETKDGKREYEEVYVGVCDELLTKSDTYQMILNPGILE